MVEKTLKLRDLVNRFSSIQALRVAENIRAKLAFELSVLAGQATAVMRMYEETQNTRFKALVVKNKEEKLEIPPEKRDGFTAEMEDLLDKEVQLKAEVVGLPENFELKLPEDFRPKIGIVGILTDWPEFFVLKG